MPRCPVCHRRLLGGAACPTDGGVAPTDRALESGPPPSLPGFDLAELLGAGGSASVWAASTPDGPVAVKIARASGALWRTRFAREAEALDAIGPPHAPRLSGQGVLADGRPWIAMERIDGATLADELARMPGPDLARGRALAAAALDAVRAVHRRGLVHRDLKPENMFLRRLAGAEIATLTDFGLATGDPTLARAAAPGWTLGTLGYMAPEVLAGGAGDARADVYALGVILYEIFTLRAPFAGNAPALERAHMALRPPPPGQLAPLPRALDDLILACLAKEPERRPADASAVHRELLAARGPTSAPARRPTTRPIAPDEEVVALAWVEPDTGPARLAAEIARTPGLLVRQRGRITLSLFTAARSDQPAADALAATTRFLASFGGRAALHVDSVDLRRREGRPPAAYGAPIDRPERWLPPAGTWSGVLLTRDFVDALGDLAVVPAAQPGFFAPAGALAAAPPPLVGRADLMAALEASARDSLAADRPALVALVGPPGSGKSRLLAEVAAARFGAAEIIEIAAGQRAADALDGEELRQRARGGPLVVLVDDAHLADDAVLDALEYATLGGAQVPIWILAAADARALDPMRPRFGQRAARSERFALEPLADDAMRELAAWLLVPADYLPAAVLQRLALLAGGNPGLLSELVRTLKREGAVRPRSDRRSHQVAIDAIERVPATAAGRWEASRALDALPPELAASARVAAAFGPIIDEAELDWVEDALEREGEGSFFDARVALRALAGSDMIAERGGAWAFTSPLVQDAIYQAMRPEERARIHRHALGYWRGREGWRALAGVARHAGLAGERDEALAAALTLAERAAAAHRELEAERWYSEALLQLGDQAIRMRALVGRGRVRWRLDRGPEALADLSAARALGRELGGARELAAVLLDEAMVLDWCGDVAGSTALAEEARALIEQAGDEALAARLLVASGRTLWRQGRVAEALELLARAAERAADVETRLIALLLSGCALAWVGRLDDAEAAFAEAETLARDNDDRLHLCAVHVNRFFLWIAREDPERGARDLRRAAQLARELGHPDLERGATHNLAELLHFECRDEEALPLAHRSFALQQRFVAQPGPEDALLLGRIALGLGDGESAARHLAWLEASSACADAAPTYRVFHRALDMARRGGDAA
ncbi:MAG TPA: protein kinase, partial [Kofleriaceae bacterium]|nr:protein kinase [Kofleriaceae bacterium]